MGRGSDSVLETVLGADGSRYRRGRRKLITAPTPALPGTLTLPNLSHSGSEQLKFLRNLATNTWLVEQIGDGQAGGKQWQVCDPSGEIYERCWCETDGIDAAGLQIRSSEHGGRVRVVRRDGSEDIYESKGRQNGWCDPLAPMQFELAEKRSQLASIAPYRPKGFKLYVTKIGMTIGRVPQEFEDQFEELLDDGFTCSLQPLPPEDLTRNELTLRIDWHPRLV